MMTSHPWHTACPGKNAPITVDSIIEITRDSKAKYELDKETGLLRLDRVLNTDLRYPFDYGFIPQTYCEDNDPLDIIVLCSERVLPLSIIEATVIGAFRMIDDGQMDDKIIAVATHDPYLKHLQKLEDLSPERLATFKFFFEHYKQQEHKKVIIEGLLAKEEAQQLVAQAMQAYTKKFNN